MSLFGFETDPPTDLSLVGSHPIDADAIGGYLDDGLPDRIVTKILDRISFLFDSETLVQGISVMYLVAGSLEGYETGYRQWRGTQPLGCRRSPRRSPYSLGQIRTQCPDVEGFGTVHSKAKTTEVIVRRSGTRRSAAR